MLDPIAWDPIALLRDARSERPSGLDTPTGKDGFALIVLNQSVTPYVGILEVLWKNACVRIAADGGANCLYEVGGKLRNRNFDNLDVIIGDLDSLGEPTRLYYTYLKKLPTTSTRIIRVEDQNSTDFGKAVEHVRRKHGVPIDIVAVGGLGGRVDQGLSQLHHLYLFQTHPRYAEGRMYLFSGESLTFLLKAGSHRIRVRRDDGRPDVFDKWVGIVPVKEPSRITTRGLEWDVTDWETAFGGQISTSNHVLPETEVVHVDTTKDVLFTIALKQIPT
ncbi:putative thiamine pyrophosphokinase [Echria macrotheca]|uniref:Thiamine pyrophosphokinase n=1 Tax=Echria macrotheca TaxID=438768 RepID=A0AAJ0BID8_9PEZI|nr:putative thiamine pyrophosphokinase [Echria macrotheca]